MSGDEVCLSILIYLQKVTLSKETASKNLVRNRFAYTELYIAITTLLRRFDFQLYETVRERDVNFARDCFIGETHPDSSGVRMKIVGMRS